MYQGYETLLIERRGRALWVVFNRPERRNATNPLMHQELVRIFAEIGGDPDADVVVLTGAGDAFSAGGDIDNMARSLDDEQRWSDAIQEAKDLLFNLVDLDRPVIARINGHAVGLGATLALFCDISIAVEHAKIADPHVKIGLTPGDGGALIWPLLIGYARAKPYLFTGEPITGAEAARMGLVTEAVAPDRLDARIEALVTAILANPSPAVRSAKRATNMLLRQQLEAVIDGHLALETETHRSHDHREAVNAFRERRAPVFRGH
ncbi:MAG: enoyl-CoA hydratase/isomerase family protein [Hyphomonadaceae bacterium]|nr:enoyl-CoA hydratase/isomerase family protein [Hyphomonadaceae bacterium]GIK50209.1 MAG: enoyl-CoA hydratase [Alphaproteobacteria bacterium]